MRTKSQRWLLLLGCMGCFVLESVVGSFPYALAVAPQDALEETTGINSQATPAGESSNTTTSAVGESEVPATIDFVREIRPILSDNCYACHGPDTEKREASLRLDDQESAFGEADSGQHAIVPGNADQSELIRRITSDDPYEKMPPEEFNKTLTDNQKTLLRQWIDQGASWQSHWAFESPTRSEIPEVSDPSWPRNPIDSFIMARLDQEDLKPSQDADKETLLRRVTFDLIGLPPTLSEIDAFLEDTSPEAYERVVDRLLASPHYGEHQARFFLDAARYGDTHGLHLDNYREIWPYRDWVVRAFNQNMPYDQFVVAQLAGDLLPHATLDDQIATGFNRCNVSTSEGGSIEEEVYVRNVIDRVVATGTVFMGLTLECTRCHDHKYDPLTMRDFYSMFAFFNSLDGPALDGNVKDTKPTVLAPNAAQKDALASLQMKHQQLVAHKEGIRSAREGDFQQWIQRHQEQSADSRVPIPGPPSEGLAGYYALEDKPSFGSGQIHGKVKSVDGQYGKAFQLEKNAYLELGSLDSFTQDQSLSIGAWVQIPEKLSGVLLSKAREDRKGYVLRVDKGRVGVDLLNKPDRYGIQVISEHRVLATPGWHHILVTYDGTGKAGGVVVYVDGHRQKLDVKLDSLVAEGKVKSIDVADQPWLVGRLGQGRTNQGEALENGKIDELRFYDRRLSSVEVIDVMLADGIGKIFSQPKKSYTDQQFEQLRNYYFHRYDIDYVKTTNQIDQNHLQEVELKSQFPTTLVYREKEKPREAFVLIRGEYDQKGEKVNRNTPAFLPPMEEDLPQDRLGLARWLISGEHPLTARVAVNRYWAHCFGTGLVKTTENFGSQGEVPSHPELLDWLALEWMESGWNIKEILKTIVLSRTYQQSSRIPAKLLELDLNNRLLARGPRFRLDAEMLRDQALAVSGLLVPKMGGPSVKPPQPDGLWHAVGYSGSNTVRFVADQGPEKVHRRTLYTFVKRTSTPPQMSTFDGPSRESCCVRRERTNTPLQALLMLDDPQFVEAARSLAERAMLEQKGDPDRCIRTMYRLCTGHQPMQESLTEMRQLYQDMLSQFQEQEESAAALIGIGAIPANDQLDPSQLAAWTMVANLILNLDEVLTKN